MSKNFKTLLFNIAVFLMVLFYTGFVSLCESPITPIEFIATILLCCCLSVIYTYAYISCLLKSFKDWWKE